MSLLKSSLLALSLPLGSFCLYAGLGHQLGPLDYDALAGYGIPLGIGFFLLSVLFASRWKVPSETRH
jgi:hypothetical protein